MPELPEVEFAARYLRRWACGRQIEAFEVGPGAQRLFRPMPASLLVCELTGARIDDVVRMGKHLLITLSKGGAPLGLLSHLGMTGKWGGVHDSREGAPSHSRVQVYLDDGSVLHYCDPRLFGRFRLVPGARFLEVPDIASLGPDPWAQGIDLERFGALLGRSRLPVKVKLLDQRLLPGVGNIHASEACFRARIDPRRPSDSLSATERRRLAKSVIASFRAVLEGEKGQEIVYLGEGGQNRFLVYGREGESCRRCRRGTLRKMVQAGRSTYFCPQCQRSRS